MKSKTSVTFQDELQKGRDLRAFLDKRRQLMPSWLWFIFTLLLFVSLGVYFLGDESNKDVWIIFVIIFSGTSSVKTIFEKGYDRGWSDLLKIKGEEEEREGIGNE